MSIRHFWDEEDRRDHLTLYPNPSELGPSKRPGGCGKQLDSVLGLLYDTVVQRKIAGTCAPVLLVGELITVVGACSSTLP
jgi:hypothetical protein